MTAISSTTLRLRVLGAPALVDEGGRTPPGLGWGKPLALLCYLAVRGEARRDELVDLLWRDVDEDKARNAFRQALHRLRSALGDQIVPHDRDRLRLGVSDLLTIDVLEFEQHARARRLDRAVDLYAGDFLEATELAEPPFDHWAEQERNRLRAQFRQLLQDAVLEASAAGQWAEAIARAKRLQRVAPFEPEAAQLAATTLLSAGRRIEALELLRHFSQRTERDLGIPAHPEIQALITRLSRESLSPPQTPLAQPAIADALTLPFVGREAELSQLASMWHSVGEDRGGVVLVEGEAGIGKSRLAHEFTANARSLGSVLVLNGRERAAGAQLPYGIFGEALRPLAHAPGVAGASAHLLAEAARLLPEMRDNFELPQVSSVEDEAARLRFFEGVAALVDAAAYEQRLLIVLEDLQHSPPSSIDLLSYLIARLAGSPVMFLLTLGPIDATSVVARLRAITTDASSQGRGTRSRRVTLGPIGTEQMAVALRQLAATTGISESSIDRILRYSGGNPLRLLHAANAAAAGEEVSSSPTPLRDVLLDRLQRLTSTQRRVLLVLALLGRPAQLSLLSAASHVSEAAGRDAIHALQTQGFVQEREGTFEIANAIASEIALEVAGVAGRAFLAGWIADALTRGVSPEPAELARLWAAAGNAAEAFVNARRAAFDFLANGAVVEATQMFTLARTFAVSPAEHADVEGTLDALGAGRRRIAVGTNATTPPAEKRERTEAQPAPFTTPYSIPRWQRLFPNWRVLFGAALATLLVSAVVLAMRTSDAPLLGSRSADTLVVAEEFANGLGARRLAVGDPESGFSLGSRVERPIADPPWVDSLPRQWSSALPSPRGLRVAAARSTARGMDLYVIGRDRRDSIALLVNQRSAIPLGWSPDGRWLLATQSRPTRAGFDVQLFSFHVTDARRVAVDTTTRHVVTEATWSPDGTHIAWVARVGTERQLDVFVSLADGSDVANVSADVADDYHIAWSPDGDLLAFTTTRGGNPELYAMDLSDKRLHRLTEHPSQDDRATFSPDGKTIAFESSRGGAFGVYVMPRLGGPARSIASASRLEIMGWRGAQGQFLDRVRIDVGDIGDRDSAVLHLHAFDNSGDAMRVPAVDWRVMDDSLLEFVGGDSKSPTRRVRGLRAGLARVIATVGRWRADTAVVRVGSDSILLVSEPFKDLGRWRRLGRTASLLHGNPHGLALRTDREWESGVLSRFALPLSPGLEVLMTIQAPWDSSPDIVTDAGISLVVPEEEISLDSIAPQFLKLASVSWKADAGRLVYAVGKEVFSQPIGMTSTRTRRVRIFVENDTTVAFSLDDVPRWRSSLRVSNPRTGSRAQIWIDGRATDDQVRVTALSAKLVAK